MSFLSQLFKRTKKESNITICGLDDAGKTTIVKYLETGEFVDTSPTMGVNHDVMYISKIELNIYDVAGQEDFRDMWAQINEKSNCIIFVVDRSNPMRFDEAKKVFHTTLKAQLQENLKVAVLLNKSDKAELISKSDFIEQFNLTGLSYDWAIFEVSAKTGAGIFEAFKWVIDNLLGD